MCVVGPSRRFKRLCELFQSVLLSSSRGPPTARRISSDLASNSSSSSYNSIDRLSPTPSNDDVTEALLAFLSSFVNGFSPWKSVYICQLWMLFLTLLLLISRPLCWWCSFVQLIKLFADTKDRMSSNCSSLTEQVLWTSCNALHTDFEPQQVSVSSKFFSPV